MVTITGDYTGDFGCSAAHGPSGTAIATDAPKDNQGKGAAFSPTDLVAAALATCIVTTMAIVARRHGIELHGLRYQVTKEMSVDAPRRITRLGVDLWMPPEARRLPAGLMETTADSCPVSRSLAADVNRTIAFHWA